MPKTFSVRAIQRELHRQKFWRRTETKTLGVSGVNRKKLQYCKIKLKSLPKLGGREFTNETTIVIKPDGKIKVWRKKY